MQDTVIRAVALKDRYSIHFDMGLDSHGNSISTLTKPEDEQNVQVNSVLDFNNPTASGYTFDHWIAPSPLVNGKFPYTQGNTHMPVLGSNGATLTLTAVWKAITITVSLDVNNGDGTADNSCTKLEITFGELLTPLECKPPTRQGYKFGGYEVPAKVNAKALADKLALAGNTDALRKTDALQAANTGVNTDILTTQSAPPQTTANANALSTAPARFAPAGVRNTANATAVTVTALNTLADVRPLDDETTTFVQLYDEHLNPIPGVPGYTDETGAWINPEPELALRAIWTANPSPAPVPEPANNGDANNGDANAPASSAHLEITTAFTGVDALNLLGIITAMVLLGVAARGRCRKVFA
jgi:uncharacterized repeat protein (TIGR02543 family)